MTLYGCRTFVAGLGAYMLLLGRLKFIITISLIYGVSLFNMFVGPVA
jgi:hypothetical protein